MAAALIDDAAEGPVDDEAITLVDDTANVLVDDEVERVVVDDMEVEDELEGTYSNGYVKHRNRQTKKRKCTHLLTTHPLQDVPLLMHCPLLNAEHEKVAGFMAQTEFKLTEIIVLLSPSDVIEDVRVDARLPVKAVLFAKFLWIDELLHFFIKNKERKLTNLATLTRKPML